MGRQISKQAIFGNRRATSPLSPVRTALGIYNPSSGGRPQNKYLQREEAALAGIEFLAQERNKGVASRETLARVDMSIAHETAYQAAKTNAATMNSPDAWEKAADDAAKASMDTTVGSGNPVTNWLSGVTRSNERLDAHRKSLRKDKIADIQQGRVDARKRYYTEAANKNILSLRQQLSAPSLMAGSTVARNQKFELARSAIAQKVDLFANGSSDSPGSGILNDDQLGAAYKQQEMRSLVDAVGATFFNHIVRTDPQNARSYVNLLDDIASNPIYSSYVNDEKLQERKSKLHTAEKLVGTMALAEGLEKQEDLGNRFEELNQSYRDTLTKISSNADKVGLPASTSLSLLEDLKSHRDVMLAATYTDKNNNEVLLYQGKGARDVQGVYDKAALALLSPVYDRMASDWLVLTKNEDVADPKTLTDAADYIHNLREKDPYGFFKLANTLSREQQNIYASRLALVVAGEKSNAAIARQRKGKTDLLSKTALDLDDFGTALRTKFSSIDPSSPPEAIAQLQEFLTEHWKNGVLKRFTDGSQGKFTPDEMNEHVLKFRKTVGASLNNAFTLGGTGGVNSMLDIAKEILHKPADYPALFSFMKHAGLEGTINTQNNKAIADRVKELTGLARNSVKAVQVYLDRSESVPDEVLSSHTQTLLDAAKAHGLSAESMRAIVLNTQGFVKFTSGLFAHKNKIAEGLTINDAATSLGNIDSVLRRIDLVQKQIDNPTAGPIILSDVDGNEISMPRIPAFVSLLQQGSDTGGGHLPLLRRAIESTRTGLNTLRHHLNPSNARLGEGGQGAIVKTLRDFTGMNQLVSRDGGETTQTRRDLALNNPQSEHGANYRALGKLIPALIIQDGAYFKQQTSGRFTAKSNEEAQVYLNMGQMAWDLTNILADRGMEPSEDFRDVADAWVEANSSQNYSDSDLTGRAAYMSRVINRDSAPDDEDTIVGEKSIAGQFAKRVNTKSTETTITRAIDPSWWFSSSKEPPGKLTSVIKSILGEFGGLQHSYKHLSKFESIVDPSGIEPNLVQRELEKIQSPFNFKSDKFMENMRMSARRISSVAKEKGLIGATTTVWGGDPEFSPTGVIVEHPMEGNVSPSFKKLVVSAGEKHSLQNTGAILKSLATIEGIKQGLAQGVSIEQLRRAFDLGDIINAFGKGNLGEKPAQFFANFVNNEFRANLEGQDFFSADEIKRASSIKGSPFSTVNVPFIGERGLGVWSSAQRDLLENSLWANITNSPTPNHVRIIPSTVSGPGSAPRKLNGLTGYTIEFSIPPVQVPFKTKFEQLQATVLGGEIVVPAKPETITITNWTAGENWDKNRAPTGQVRTLRGRYMSWMIGHMESQVALGMPRHRDGQTPPGWPQPPDPLTGSKAAMSKRGGEPSPLELMTDTTSGVSGTEYDPDEPQDIGVSGTEFDEEEPLYTSTGLSGTEFDPDSGVIPDEVVEKAEAGAPDEEILDTLVETSAAVKKADIKSFGQVSGDKELYMKAYDAVLELSDMKADAYHGGYEPKIMTRKRRAYKVALDDTLAQWGGIMNIIRVLEGTYGPEK